MKKTLLLTILVTCAWLVRASDTLTVRQVFDFDTGDTLDYQTGFAAYNVGPNPQYGGGYIRRVVSGKWYAPDSSTLYYQIATTYPTPHIDTIAYAWLDSSLMLLDSFQSNPSYTFTSALDSFQDQTNTIYWINTDQGITHTYSQGLGLIYAYYGWGNITEPYGYYDTVLVYFSGARHRRGRPYYTFLTGLAEIGAVARCQVFPFPATESINVTNCPIYGQTLFTLTDLSGRSIYSSCITQPETTHDISALPAGLYIWQVQSNGTIIQTGKIMKQ